MHGCQLLQLWKQHFKLENYTKILLVHFKRCITLFIDIRAVDGRYVMELQFRLKSNLYVYSPKKQVIQVKMHFKGYFQVYLNTVLACRYVYEKSYWLL